MDLNGRTDNCTCKIIYFHMSRFQHRDTEYSEKNVEGAWDRSKAEWGALFLRVADSWFLFVPLFRGTNKNLFLCVLCASVVKSRDYDGVVGF